MAVVHTPLDANSTAVYNAPMEDKTISGDSALGKHLEQMTESKGASYLVFNKKKIQMVKLIKIGRDADNDVVVDNKLASRNHAVIQKIRDAYFIQDLESTNGTFVNDVRIPNNKYVKLNSGDKITIGNAALVIV